MDQLIVAKDGLPARSGGAWAREKLDFLDTFGPPALAATKTKRDRVFLDLFAGPGLNVIKGTGEEFPGSPMRIPLLTAPRDKSIHFTRAIFCNLEEDCHQALGNRLTRLLRSGACAMTEMECAMCDSNLAVRNILATIHPQAYIFAFADIEGVQQLPWSTIAALRARHTSVDLYVLVPVEMSFNRLLGPKATHREKNGRVLDEYFGHTRWRSITDGWTSQANGRRVRRELLDMYLAGLRTLWRTADIVEVGRFAGRRLLYRMIFASDHPAASRIAKWASERPHGGQGSFNLT